MTATVEPPEKIPDCIRCGHPVTGWRTIGAALLHTGPHAGFYACGNCSTTAEHHAHLRWLLARGHGHWRQGPQEEPHG